MKIRNILLAIALLASGAVNAAAVIDFSTGLAGSGGIIEDVNGDGSYITGTDVNIGALEAVGTSNDGVYITNALLNFDTNDNTITIEGTIADLGINSSILLLSGSFINWDYDGGLGTSFSGEGTDVKHDDLLNALNLPLDTQFEFFGFSLAFDFELDGTGTAISTDILNTTVVPVPAAVWLFASGLLGMVGVARRRS